MRIPALYLAVGALSGAVWLQWSPLSPADPDISASSLYWTKPNAVLCETPFQLRKAIVAMRQDDGVEIMSLGCTRLGAGRRARLISAPVTRYGPLLVDVTSAESVPAILWGYADQFEPDED